MLCSNGEAGTGTFLGLAATLQFLEAEAAARLLACLASPWTLTCHVESPSVIVDIVPRPPPGGAERATETATATTGLAAELGPGSAAVGYRSSPRNAADGSFCTLVFAGLVGTVLGGVKVSGLGG